MVGVSLECCSYKELILALQSEEVHVRERDDKRGRLVHPALDFFTKCAI